MLKMKKRVAGLGVLAAFAFQAQALDIGDKAPPLELKQWLNGESVNPAASDGKTVYVVEFWATWCGPCKQSIPHLNELQAEYKDKHVVIVGITKEPEETVKPFAAKMKMAYRIGLDTDDTTGETYMKDVRGIPHAFIVDQKGIVVWAGHPMSGMAEALARVVKGDFDADAARDQAKLEGELRDALSAGEFSDALKVLDKLIAKGSEDLGLLQMKARLLLQVGDSKGFKKACRAMLEAAGESQQKLNEVAWMLVTSPFEGRDLGTALKAADKANGLAEGKDNAILDTLARVYYSVGLLDKAIETQRKSVGVTEDAGERKGIEKTLAYYEEAKKVQQSVK